MFQHSYPEGRFEPERDPRGCGWYVWCVTGALKALATNEHVGFLAEHPENSYLILFANGAFARNNPGSPLWEAMREITQNYMVEFFPFGSEPKYVEWTEDKKDERSFDAICIRTKVS